MERTTTYGAGSLSPVTTAVIDGSGIVVTRAARSIALVRRYVADACVTLGWGDSVDIVTLLVSEVATNAVLHGSGPSIRVRVLNHGERLRVDVFDGSPVLPVQRRTALTAEDGRGLALVEAFAFQWGADALPDGKTTWFEIDV